MRARSAGRTSRRSALPCAWLLCILALAARGDERGFPLITVYPAETHKAGPQTFDVAQDPRGVLYFGNLHGLVTYDGAWWRLLKLPDDQLALSVAADARGRVVAGLVNDLGTIVRDANGTPQYRSLLPLVPEAQRDFGDVRSACAIPNGFLFVTEQSLLIWDGRAIRVAGAIDRTNGPRFCRSGARGTWLYGPNGLQRFDPATARLGPKIISERVDVVIDHGDGHLTAAVRDKGLFQLDGQQVAPFSPSATEWLKGKIATSGCRLADGRTILTTRQHGLAILDIAGEVEQRITDASGLPDAVINESFADAEGSLWLAMEGPIARVDVASPVSLFDARRGLKGAPSDVARFNGQLYVASTHGLYRVDERGAVHAIEGIRDAWRLLPVDDDLIVGTGRGMYRLRANAAPEQILEKDGEIYDLYRSQVDPNRVWIAQRDGISSVRRDGTRWIHEPVLQGVPEYASTVIERGGAVWAGTVFGGVARVSDPRGAHQRVKKFGSGETNVFEVGDRVIAIRATGEIYSIDARDQYVADPLLGHLKAPRGFFAIAEDARGDVWINSTPPRVFARQANGSYAREGKPLVGVTAADIQTLRAHPDGVVWFASDRGLFRYERAAETTFAGAQPPPLIRRVLAGEDRELPREVELAHDFGRMRIEFAPVSYRPGVEYQYRLDPIDGHWSQWTEQPFIDYTTLEANDYTFRLRARGPSMVPSGETAWTFSVLPPWYRTAWAWALWALLALGAIALVIRVRTAALRRQAEKLRARVDEKTAELQETVQLLEQANTRLEALSLEDDLTGIANRRYFERSLTDEWNRARRRDTPLALILLDLDHFKDLNDRRGHPAGDDCLRRVGAFLADAIRRSGEVVARYGGEEFAILLPGVDGEGAVKVAEALRDGIERLSIPYGNGQGRRVTASCGVAATIPAPDGSADMLVASADRALYAAKHSGRNCVKIADESTTGTWLRNVSA